MKNDPIEELAEQIQPLAVLITALTEELRVVMQDVKNDFREQSESYQTLLSGLIEASRESAREWSQAAEAMREANKSAFKLELKIWAIVLLIGLMAAAPGLYLIWRLH